MAKLILFYKRQFNKLEHICQNFIEYATIRRLGFVEDGIREMKIKDAKEGLRVLTIRLINFDRYRLLSVDPKHLNVRQEGKEGVLAGGVPGQKWKVWWVIHSDRTVGAYILEELELI